jgi:hypothetical protein
VKLLVDPTINPLSLTLPCKQGVEAKEFIMPLLGQASGGWTESSSALRLLHVGVRNTVGVLTPDAFTQNNPPIVTAAATVSAQVDTTVFGVLSGSVAFTRPDIGANFIGGNAETLAVAAQETLVRPLGCFINSANGNAFENLPGQASGKGPYVSAQGTYGNALFETQVLDGTAITNFATGDAFTYVTGVELHASRNGYLMPSGAIDGGGTFRSFLNAANSAELEHGLAASTLIGILKMPADAVMNKLVYDQRI